MAKEIIKELTVKELEDKLHDYKEELRNLRFQMVTGQVQNFKRKNFVRKKIAQIKTILNEYKIGIRKGTDNDDKAKKESSDGKK